MELRVTANLIWDVKAETFEDGKKQASFLLETMIDDKPIRRSLSISQIVRKKQERLGMFRPEEVLPFVTTSGERQEFRIAGKTWLVRMNSHRYHLFARNLNCVSCGLVGSLMAMELSPGSDFPHFNLYALDGGSEVLMTKDHIKPVAQGGPDRHENYQLMCSICNNIKGDSTLTLEDVGFLRTLYNANINRISSVQLAALLRDEKIKRDTSGRLKGGLNGSVPLIPSLNVGTESSLAL